MLSAHLEGGGSALFLTLTCRHTSRDRLAPRLDVMARSLRVLLRGRPWEKRAARYQYLGAIKAIEITHGGNGWHPHSHSVLLFDRQLDACELDDLRAWICRRWSGVVEAHGFGTLDLVAGVDLRPIRTTPDVASYLTKVEGGWGAGLELTRSDLKGNSPWALLRQFVQTGDRRMLDLWTEYEEATFGKRALVISPKVRARYLVDEATDEELASVEGADDMLLQALVPQRAWNTYTRSGALPQLLNDVEHTAAALLLVADLLGTSPPPLRLLAAGADGGGAAAPDQGRGAGGVPQYQRITGVDPSGLAPSAPVPWSGPRPPSSASNPDP